MTKQTSQLIQGLQKKGVEVIDDQSVIEPVTQGDFKKEVEDEVFMNEPVTVLIFPTTDVNAPPYVCLSVNGERAVVSRAVPTTIKRKHLEVLARMKETRYTQPGLQKGGLVEMGLESLVGHTAHAYPFNILRDDNPRGSEWLMHVMAEPSSY
jgi:hypothetical protein